MVEKTHLNMTCQELYNLVWSKPMTKIAKDFGVSDRAVAKTCARRQVPVPPRGYWAKKTVGIDSPRPPLVPIQSSRVKSSKITSPNEKQLKKNLSSFKFLQEPPRPLPKKIDFAFKISEWEWEADFSMNLDEDGHLDRSDPYSDFRSFSISGTICYPNALKDKVDKIHITLLPNIKNYGTRQNPKSMFDIGELNVENGALCGYIDIPLDMGPELLALATCGHLNSAKVVCKHIGGGEYSVLDYSFRSSLEKKRQGSVQLEENAPFQQAQMFLTPEELHDLTRRKMRGAQIGVLNFMGIEHRVRPDGKVLVLREHALQVFGCKPTVERKRRPTEPNFEHLK